MEGELPLNVLLKNAKEAFERMTGCRIYRNSSPRGTDLLVDLDRYFGRRNFKVIFDVGANIGQTATSFQAAFPNAAIYSFEPVPSTYASLIANTSHLKHVQTFNYALGPEAGEATINVNPTHVASSASSMKESRPGDESHTIQVDTIAAFTERYQIQNVDLLKIDTEGFDLQVLRGGAPLLEQQRIQLVFTECEPIERTKFFVTLAEAGAFMRRYGYELFGVYEQQSEWDGRRMLLYCNALFVCPRLAKMDAALY
jgi:FkbM family methyltransferase